MMISRGVATRPFFYFLSALGLLLLTTSFSGCSKDDPKGDPMDQEQVEDGDGVDNSDGGGDGQGEDPIGDVNGDGELNILILGTSRSINTGTEAFSSDSTADELQKILMSDTNVEETVNVAAEDIYLSKQVEVGLGSGGSTYNYMFYGHSLMQYWYWPENSASRQDNLMGNGSPDWDYVIISGDPYIVATLPGYFALGVHKIAAKVAEGGARPILLMGWPKESVVGAGVDHFEEVVYRVSDGATVTLPTVPAGLVWDALSDGQQDVAAIHPTPNGAYVAAAAIYSHIYDRSATVSDYAYDDTIADLALAKVREASGQTHYSGPSNFESPFMACGIQETELNYNHTGTSSENGILQGLNWVIGKSDKTLTSGGTPPINFNYGRANTNFEANKRYKVDAAQFDFSIGFPMQDGSSNGELSMQYGLDKRFSDSENGTDLGVALYMVRNSELPYARAVPVRTLLVQLKEAIPGQSAYRDSWHMHRDLDKAIAAYMYTLLTGDCALGPEPTDKSSSDWKSWMAHKIGYETAWTLMYLEGNVPNCE